MLDGIALPWSTTSTLRTLGVQAAGPEGASSRSLGEDLVDELHRGRALTHRGRHALHAPRPHVANREHPGQAGLEVIGPASQGPLRGLELLGREVRAGLDEALLVE